MPEIFGLDPETDEPTSWNIDISSPEINHLRVRYGNIPDEEFSQVISSAVNILSKCPNPSLESARRTGLAIGKIQSGKTLSFTALVGLAATNGYGIIIVLAGTKDALMNQTYDRLRKDLGINHPQNISRIYIQDNPRISISEGVTSALDSGRCVLFVVLKHANHITGVADLIKTLPRRPVLIIDDEGDEASLNNYFKKGGRSATYRSIINLRESIRNNAYVAYTATPQANLLLKSIDGLKPDFCELIEPGEGYCGGSEFFGERSDNYIRDINDVDENTADEGQIPPSLENALAIFFVTAAIRHMRADLQRHSMLIHMSVRKEAHRKMSESVSGKIRSWKDTFKLRQADPSRQTLIELFKRVYDVDISKTSFNSGTWESIEPRLIRELNSCELHMVNSLPQGIQIAESTFQLENNIVIGGNILGRGLTIQELTVSYMARRAKGNTNADTMEQRARWFGYKRDYLDLCRIFIPARVRSDFEGLLEHEDDFWESLRRNISQNIPLDRWPRMLILNSLLGINPTRSSVASYKRFRPNDWEIQRTSINVHSVVEDNKKVIDEFFRKHKATRENFGSTSHTVIRDCSISEVIFLLRNINSDNTDWDNSYITEYIERLHLQLDNGNPVLGTMDIFLMANGEWRDRKTTDGKIDELFQGSNPNYDGDRYLEPNRAKLQIHLVQCMSQDDMPLNKTTALAFYVPNEGKFNLSFVVRGD